MSLRYLKMLLPLALGVETLFLLLFGFAMLGNPYASAAGPAVAFVSVPALVIAAGAFVHDWHRASNYRGWVSIVSFLWVAVLNLGATGVDISELRKGGWSDLDIALFWLEIAACLTVGLACLMVVGLAVVHCRALRKLATA